jgi:hypothetical protein
LWCFITTIAGEEEVLAGAKAAGKAKALAFKSVNQFLFTDAFAALLFFLTE